MAAVEVKHLKSYADVTAVNDLTFSDEQERFSRH